MLADAMSELERLGTAQNRKVYARHGSGDNAFGVSFADLRAMAKRIGVDHALAEALWKTGNCDARSLATLIADPNGFTAASAETWANGIDYYLLADLLAPVIARSKLAHRKLAKWTGSRKEYVRQCGYNLLACLLKESPEAIDDDLCRSYLSTIEGEIHDSPNRARHAMNMAVIAIGIYKPTLLNEALAAARHIGKVEVDHGATSCKTPDAAAYIHKAAARERSRKNAPKPRKTS